MNTDCVAGLQRMRTRRLIHALWGWVALVPPSRRNVSIGHFSSQQPSIRQHFDLRIAEKFATEGPPFPVPPEQTVPDNFLYFLFIFNSGENYAHMISRSCFPLPKPFVTMISAAEGGQFQI